MNSVIGRNFVSLFKMMSAQLQQQQPAADGAAPPALGNQSLGSDELPPVRNRASESKSPYVFLHADTPVAWQPMSEETLARAKAENKPIYMHIGFLADHRKLFSAVAFNNNKS